MATIEELRFWCFGGAAPAPGGSELPDAEMFRAMAYRFEPDKHPEMRDDYRSASMRDLPLTLELQRIKKIFREAEVRFAPIKGADLAYSCYPDPALRSRCDIDLLVHPDDIDRAVAAATDDGWRTPHQYRSEHHAPSMYKKHAMLELHFTLPDFPPDAIPRIWELLRQEEGSTEFRLPPELSLAVACQHARKHRWINGAALIADYAFLLKAHPGFDWDRARARAREFEVADPSLICFALPELFPSEAMPQGPPPPPEVAKALRDALLAAVNLQVHRDSAVMNSPDRFGRDWWRGRFAGFRPEAVRFRYHLPDSAGTLRMFRAYCRMAVDKSVLVWNGIFRSDPAVSTALRRVEIIEKYLGKSR